MGQARSASQLYGRDRELGDLLASLDETSAGRGRLILLGGDPGIGKTRLADELAARARVLGWRVLWGRAWETAGAPPYWPWVQAIRGFVRSMPPEEIRRDLGTGLADVAQMLPELRDLFSAVPTLPDDASESARFRLFDSTATFLRAISRRDPLVIVLDDLHAADTPSILFLRFLATQVSDMPLLVVGTYRDVELTAEHPLTTAIGELARDPAFKDVRLTGLSAAAVGAFIASAAGVRPSTPLAEAVARATNGNPLFVGEAVRLLSAEGRLMEVADPTALHVAVPPGIRAVIARRIEHLDVVTAQVLQLASVIGPEFGQDVLRRVGGYGPEIVDYLQAAVGSKLLAPVPGVRGRYRFFHGLVRETLYDDLSPARRVRLHGEIGTVLEQLRAGDDETRLAELAFHFGLAAQRDEDGPEGVEIAQVVRKAIEYARRAGDNAAHSLAYEEAARLYRMALAALDLERRGDAPEHLDVLLSLGDVEGRAGSFDTARSAFLDAAVIARSKGDGVGMARAALGVGGRVPWARAGHDARLLPLLQDALVLLGGRDEPLRARLLTRLAGAWRSSPERRQDSASLSRQAVEIGRGLDDKASLSNALIGQYWATYWPDNISDRIDIADELSRIAQDLDDGERMTDAQLLSVTILIEQGRLVEGRRESAALGRIIGELRQPAYRWIEQMNEALLALIAGDYAGAEVWIDREMDTPYRLLPASDNLCAARSHRYLLRREQGRVAEEEGPLRVAADACPWYPFLRAELVCLLLDLGRDAEARSLYDDLARDSFAAIYPDNEWLFGMGLVSDACARFEDAPGAETLYQRLLPYAGRHAVGYGEGSVGVVDRYLGLLAAALGRLDQAADHMDSAVELNGQMGSGPWAAHSQHDLAGILRRRAGPGDLERADRLDAEALATASQLGMALAGAIEGKPRAETPAAAPEPAITAAIFRNEGEYWTIEFGADAFRMRDSRGMRHLARLLASPGMEIHALELAQTGASDAPAKSAGDEVRSDGLGDAGPRLDPTAIAAYKGRLDELRAELTEAESWNDVERASRLRAEQQALAHELAAAHGLGGRDRPAASASERARVSTTRAIRASLDRIGRQSTILGAHFDATIRTGTFCAYSPDPRAPLTWRL